MALIDSLISYWKLDEISDGSGAVTRVDAHASNDLTDNNTVASGTGKISNGADFEATNSEYLSITDVSQSGLDVSGDISMSFWFKPETVGMTQVLATKFEGGRNERSYHFIIDSGNTVSLNASSDGTSSVGQYVAYRTDSAQITSTGTWYHIAMTFDISTETCTFYINGSSVASSVVVGTTIGATLFNSPAPFAIGARFFNDAPGTFPDGVIDEVGIWSKVLTSDEVTELYNGGNGLAYPFTVGGAKPQSNLLLMGAG